MRIALASWPRSGSTWLRCMIEHATGQQTGTAPDCNCPSREAMPRGEEGIVVHTHEGYKQGKWDAGILLTRDRVEISRSCFECGMTSLESSVFRLWGSWLCADIPLHVVRYEDLRRDTYVAFADVMIFLRNLGAETGKGSAGAIEACTEEKMRERMPEFYE